MARYAKILAALDGSASQEAVIRRAFSIAHDNNAEVLLAHVIDSTLFETGGVTGDDIAQANKESIEKDLARYLNRANSDPHITSVDIVVKAGNIAETLVNDIAKPFGPDLVICGVRGLSSIKYAFVGSVSTYLVRNVDCDVLVVRPESIEDVDYAEYEDYE
ncbi:MAG: universal stress protein [Coriobacteriaceae bacterium]|nr:universal stress protein [Coriobacteriaceae bacterium]